MANLINNYINLTAKVTDELSETPKVGNIRCIYYDNSLPDEFNALIKKALEADSRSAESEVSGLPEGQRRKSRIFIDGVSYIVKGYSSTELNPEALTYTLLKNLKLEYVDNEVQDLAGNNWTVQIRVVAIPLALDLNINGSAVKLSYPDEDHRALIVNEDLTESHKSIEDLRGDDTISLFRLNKLIQNARVRLNQILKDSYKLKPASDDSSRQFVYRIDFYKKTLEMVLVDFEFVGQEDLLEI